VQAGEPTRSIIPERLRGVYAEVAAKALELRQQGMTHPDICEELTRLAYRTRTGQPWHHPAQIIKLLRSFAPEGRARPRMRGKRRA
jgi:hypothetical protein